MIAVQFAAAVAGMECKLLLEKRQERDEEYELSGNVLLDELLGAEIVDRVPAGTDMQEAMELLADDLRAQGKRPYVIPGGGSIPVGALGYVSCAEELESAPVAIDWVVHGTGSTGTQAGLVAGLCAMNSPAQVLGVSVRQKAEPQIDAVLDLAVRTASPTTLSVCSPASTTASDWVRGRQPRPGNATSIPTRPPTRRCRWPSGTVGGVKGEGNAPRTQETPHIVVQGHGPSIRAPPEVSALMGERRCI